MTDNRTTELRRKLIERHVSFECSEEGNYRRTSWITNGVQWNYREFDGNTSLGMGNVWKDCSPEQAIAATLGNGNQAAMDKLKHVRETLESCRRTEEAGFDTYWITAVALDTSLDELEQAIAVTLGEQVIRCRDCKHATISTTGVCKYCEMFVLPDVDGYGADPQVNLPLDFFCGFAECKEVD